jgi:hypothetical protein
VVVVHSEPDVPAVYYADGPPCRAPLVDQSCLWGASPKA